MAKHRRLPLKESKALEPTLLLPLVSLERQRISFRNPLDSRKPLRHRKNTKQTALRVQTAQEQTDLVSKRRNKEAVDQQNTR